MTSDWILDVIGDLQAFARTNGLPGLAEQLDDTALIAMAELASAPGSADRAGRHDGKLQERAASQPNDSG